MRIRVLGCSGGIGPGLRTTSLLLDDGILIDAGTGVGDLTLDEQARVRQIFLTHSHLDHVCGLAFLADNLFCQIDEPLTVHATDETLTALRTHIFNWQIWPDFSALPPPARPVLRFASLAPDQPRDLPGGLRIHAFRVLHTVPSVGYAVQSARGTFAFSGDTISDDSLWNALNALPRLDLLMIEIAFADEDAGLGRLARHFTPALLGTELRKLRHRPQLLLTHHKPGAEERIAEECRTALDGWAYRHLRTGDLITL
ncbi:MAG: MBL fold metallo-hydrolase [Gammaproteobacteria bacterium]|jgi:ribonuclease BN (tRNA processing enzyme)